MTEVNPLLDAALAWWDAGACVLPAAADGTKRPALPWQQYQENRPSREQVEMWFDNVDIDGIGLVTGYGGFEMFEFEGRAIGAGMLQELLGLLEPALVAKLMTYAEKTPSGGLHWIYRVEFDQEGSTQLAREPHPGETPPFRVLIETRGKYAWTILAPSGGRTHETGRAWEIMAGTPGAVPTLSEGEHEALWEAARSLDRMPLPEPVDHRPALPPPPDGELTPGQDFERRADWIEDVLGQFGWTVWKRIGDKLVLTRPGKTFGASATINYDGNDNLYVFSSSTEFPAFTSWTKFGAYAHLNHGGDYTAAARELGRHGYGTRQVPSTRLTLIHGGGGDAAGGGTGQAAAATTPAATHSVGITLTDDGNAQLLVSHIQGSMLYSPERGEWLAWNGNTWQWQPGRAEVIETFRELMRDFPANDDAERKHKIKSLGFKSIENAVKLAEADRKIAVKIDALDAEPEKINTQSGVVDLRTKEITPPTPDSRHTRITNYGVSFEPPQRFLQFLATTFCRAEDPAAMIEFIQRLAGYSATGQVTHHVLPFLHGPGNNGKGVLFEILLSVLGDYAGTTTNDLLLANAKDDFLAKADLAGKRLVVASEVPPTARFHEQRAKELTGGDRVKGRFLYRNFFEFSPSHHIWIAGNHQPQVPSGGTSFWRRMRLVPFDYIVPDSDKIEGLAQLLVQAEGPQILGWIIEGAVKQFDARKLAEPPEVMGATQAYAEEEDHFGRFMAERIRLGGGKYVRVNTKIVRAAYEQWCSTEGVRPLPASPFGREMKNRGIDSDRSNGQRFYVNLTLLNSESEDGPEQQRFPE